jgi:hypothetical protein
LAVPPPTHAASHSSGSHDGGLPSEHDVAAASAQASQTPPSVTFPTFVHFASMPDLPALPRPHHDARYARGRKTQVRDQSPP